MRLRFLFIPVLFFAAGTPAQTVIYTTAQQPIINPEPGILVQVLENVSELEQLLFPVLSQNPQQAEQQAHLRMQQPDWKTQEARLTRAYQSLLDAYTLGIKKLPAVVFDDRYVVYGTTDAELAQQKLDDWREQQR
ncbi:TIGR03757 family integrating conjugative element protein [Citrobacter sp. wls619]|uniref:TIGR03757 family integrating conjugative element protein n=1 Tax=Citrobacter sp. wls619 TaxID=2576432 RepID=UPI0010C9B0D8|nr:TIGR03757 family integrating conjugative element protein [Citrobacter sp. wls619]TKV13912.1 TIGR03757 family integrating conjugative element protein [Citrobacter sp. wls619]